MFKVIWLAGDFFEGRASRLLIKLFEKENLPDEKVTIFEMLKHRDWWLGACVMLFGILALLERFCPVLPNGYQAAPIFIGIAAVVCLVMSILPGPDRDCIKAMRKLSEQFPDLNCGDLLESQLRPLIAAELLQTAVEVAHLQLSAAKHKKVGDTIHADSLLVRADEIKRNDFTPRHESTQPFGLSRDMKDIFGDGEKIAADVEEKTMASVTTTVTIA